MLGIIGVFEVVLECSEDELSGFSPIPSLISSPEPSAGLSEPFWGIRLGRGLGSK